MSPFFFSLSCCQPSKVSEDIPFEERRTISTNVQHSRHRSDGIINYVKSLFSRRSEEIENPFLSTSVVIMDDYCEEKRVIREEADAFFLKAQREIWAGEIEDALFYLNTACQLYRELSSRKSKIRLASCLKEKACCLKKLGQFREAIHLFKDSIALQESGLQGDSLMYEDSIWQLSFCYMECKQYAKALPYLVQLIQSSNVSESYLSAYLKCQGLCYMQQKQYQRALSCLEKILKWNQSEMVLSLYRIAHCQLCMGLNEQVLFNCREAISICERDGSEQILLAHCHRMHAEALLQLGSYKEAVESAERALILYRKFSGKSSKINSCLNIISQCMSHLSRMQDLWTSVPFTATVKA